MKRDSAFYRRIREILESARTGVARTVNTAQVMANWLVGREIVEEEQKGAKRAAYGAALLNELSTRLTRDFGRGWSVRQLEYCRVFYQTYPALLKAAKSNPVRSILRFEGISNAARSDSARELERQISSLLYERLAKSKDKAGLSKSEWGHDDYSLKIENLPKAPPPTDQHGQQSLFGEEVGK